MEHLGVQLKGLGLAIILLPLLGSACGETGQQVDPQLEKTTDELSSTPSPTLQEQRVTSEEPNDRDNAVKPENSPEGRWRTLPESRRPPVMNAEQANIAAELMAIGYASGSEEAEEGLRVGVTQHDPERAFAGLNLVVSGHAPEAILIDMSGALRHRWSCSFASAFPDRAEKHNVRTQMWRRAHLDPDGRLLAIYEGNGLVALDSDSNILWAYPGAAHHDVDVTPEGRVLVLTREAHLVESVNPNKPVLEDFITELDENGQELSTLSVLDCLVNSKWADCLDRVRAHAGDILHTNTLTWLDGRHTQRHPAFARGNLLISLRSINLLAIIDPVAHKVVWAMKGSWRLQHQPVLLDSGNMLLFDNGTPGARRSEILEFDPLTGEEFWSYRAPTKDTFYSKSCGSCQRLPGGTTLITETDYGRAFEVDSLGEIVWEYISPFRAGDHGELVASLFEVLRVDSASLGTWLK